MLLLLAMQAWGIRKMEAFILALIATIGACFIVEIFLSKPSWGGIAGGFVPTPLSSAGGDKSSLYIAIGILGATVMPHNLYLHSALVQSRRVERTREGIAQACRYNLIDSAVALNGAFFVNAAILIVAAATFWSRGQEVGRDRRRPPPARPPARRLGAAGVRDRAAGGGPKLHHHRHAGRADHDGGVPALPHPAVGAAAHHPARSRSSRRSWSSSSPATDGPDQLLILSQVILSLQLPFAVIPLVKFTGSRSKMGQFASRRGWAVVAWLVAAVIVYLNAQLAIGQIGDWAEAAGPYAWAVYATALPLAAGLGLLLMWMTFRPEQGPSAVGAASAEAVATAAMARSQQFRRIGVALDASDTDAAMLAEAVALARGHRAELVLMHVVEGVGGQWYGQQADDAEHRHDEQYLHDLADRMRGPLRADGVPDVRAVLGFGVVARELVRLAKKEGVDLIVAGGHGHRGLSDLLKGETLSRLRHGVAFPILTVKGGRAKVAGAFPGVPPEG